MTKEELLAIFKLLSGLESWSMSLGKTLPPYMDDQLVACMEVIERELLK